MSKKEAAKQGVLESIKHGLLEIQEAKRTGKKMKKLGEFMDEI